MEFKELNLKFVNYLYFVHGTLYMVNLSLPLLHATDF
jgi:hypothetical protein